MERPLKTTPSYNSPSRGLFEDAVRKGRDALAATIAIDTMIEDATVRILNGSCTADEIIRELSVLDDIDRFVVESFTPKETWTDVMRYANSATFATERLVVPLLFGTPNTHKSRSLAANGIVGKSLDLAASVMEGIDEFNQRASQLPQSYRIQREEMIGSLQEITLMALINYPQSADLIALPPSALEDLTQHTDIVLYRRKRSQGYMLPISVKTSVRSAEREKALYPDLCVVGAADFHNLNLEMTRLLLQEHDGHPGITDQQKMQILTARESVMAVILNKLDIHQQRIEGSTIDHAVAKASEIAAHSRPNTASMV